MVIYDHCWWYTQLPLDKFTQKCSQYKKKYWWAPANPAQFCSKLLAILKKVLVGPCKSCSILLKIARNTKRSIGGPRQILLNFAQNCSKVTQNCSKVTQNCSKVTQNYSKFLNTKKSIGAPGQSCSILPKKSDKCKKVKKCANMCRRLSKFWIRMGCRCGLL